MTRPDEKPSASWLPLLFKFAFAEQIWASIPARQDKRKLALLRARAELARRSVAQAEAAASEIHHQMQQRPDDSEQDELLTVLHDARTHPDQDQLLHGACDLIRGALPDPDLLPFLITLIRDWPVPPFEIETDPRSSDKRAALERLLLRIRSRESSTLGISASELAASAFHAVAVGNKAMHVTEGRGRSGRWWAVAAVGLVVLAATGVGLAFAVPAGLAGAAAITATLASFGPGGMVGGMATIAALTGAGSALAGGGIGQAMTHRDRESRRDGAAESRMFTELVMASTPDALKSILASVISVVSLQDALGCPSRRQQVTILLNVAIANVTDEANLHAKIAPDTATTKDFERKLEYLARARDWLGDQPPIKDISAELNR